MLPEQRRYLIVGHGVVGAAVNFLINGAVAWVMFRSRAEVPFWGQQSVIGDTIGTTFFLPFITCLIVTRIVRNHVRTGRVQGLGWTRTSHRWLGWLPERTLGRALKLGLASMLAVGSLSALALVAVQIRSMPLWSFVAFKASFAAALAFVIQPLVALWAMTSQQEGVDQRIS